MLIDFNGTRAINCPGMNGGTGTMTIKMNVDDYGKVLECAIHPGGSIGIHRHDTSDDVNFVVSGTGKAVCDGVAEELRAGCCHICRKGSEHCIVNTGSEDLVLLTVVTDCSRPR